MISNINKSIEKVSVWFSKRYEFKKIVSNSVWLLLDSLIKMIVSMFIGVWTARYLGPIQFGILNYTIAFLSFFSVLASMGLGSIVVRELIFNKNAQPTIIQNIFILRVFSGFITYILMLLFASIFSSNEILYLIIAGLSLIFQASETYDYYFQANLLSKYSVKARLLSFFTTSFIKVFIIIFQLPFIFFILTFLLEAILNLIFSYIMYKKMGHKFNLLNYDKKLVNNILRQSIPLVLTGLVITIYLKIDILIIGKMLSQYDVGIYSAAVRISETWYLLPSIILSSVFPAIINAKNQSSELYYKKIQILFDIMTWLSIFAAITIMFTSSLLIYVLFGNEYIKAASVLKIHVWSAIAVFTGSAWSNWMIVEKKQNLLIFPHIFSMVLNIILNIILIPISGINGAAWATLISYSLSNFVSFFFYKSNTVFLLIFNSIIAPIRYLLLYIKYVHKNKEIS